MPATSSASTTVTRLPVAFHLPWQSSLHKAICNNPATVLEHMDASALRAAQASDHASTVAHSAHALAYMLVDWSRFTGWQTWIARFESANAALPDSTEPELNLARATGALACALLRGDTAESQTALGLRVQALLRAADSPQDATHLALAAGVLLPWLQMARAVTDAQVLHTHMTDVWARWSAHDAATQYLSGLWLAAWAQHLHFSDPPRQPDALARLRGQLAAGTSPGLHFRAARIAAEGAINAQDDALAERAFHDMLAALRPERPMDRVIYNAMAVTRAGSRKDMDAAMLHGEHMNRDLLAADCPPSITSAYRFRESAIQLAVGNYAKVAEIYEFCAQNVSSVQASLVRGFAALARAVEIHHQHDTAAAQRDRLREQLALGLAAMRQSPNGNFFFSVPAARGTVCALALREDIEAEFVRAALKLVPTPPPIWADEHWPWSMSVRCLGGFRIDAHLADGQRADKASSRPLMLLKLIAAHGAQGVPVATALDTLWPGQDGDQAEHTLTMTLQRSRRLFVDDDLIHRNDGWLRLNGKKVWTDVAAFEAHVDAMPEIGMAASDAESTRYIKRLFVLYRGDCLLGIDDAWAMDRAAHYRSRVTFTVQRAVQQAMHAGHHAAAELALTRAIERGLDMAGMLKTFTPDQNAAPTLAALQARIASIKPLSSPSAFR